MKRKRAPESESVVPQEIMEQAKQSLQSDKLKRPAECAVCGAECAPISSEALCWVCRRLKISAWRDSDAQLSAQE
ncbi:MAG: hypothetical protein ACK5AZ_16815 [Bryobacteraceae bacterium]